MKNQYPNASALADNRVIFNIGGNTIRLVVKAKYQNGIVLIEWIGTHAEYDKKTFLEHMGNAANWDKELDMKQIRVIKTQRDYDDAVARLSVSLMDEDIKPGSPRKAN